MSAETSAVNFDEEKTEDAQTEDAAKAKLSEEEGKELCQWLSLTLGTRAREVRVTNRLSDSPAIVTDHESGALRRMMRMVEQANAGKDTTVDLPPQVLEVNPKHPLVVQLFALKDDPSSAAHLVAQQLFDNALISAGLLEDARTMLPRLNDILLASLKKQ